MSKIDHNAECITFDSQSHMMRMDQVPLFRLIYSGGVVWVEVKDGNRQRCAVRGSQQIMVPVNLFVAELLRAALSLMMRHGG